MKKKIRIVGLISALVVFAMMSMGSGSDSDSGKKEITVESSASTEATDSSVEVEAEETIETETQETTSAAEVTIEEQVVIDEEDIKVTAVSYDIDSIWGDGIKFLIENNGSSDIGLGCDALIVNDYMMSDLFTATVAAGKKDNETMDLSSSQLKAAGIDNVGKVEIYFHTYNPETYETLKKFDVVTIKTSAYDTMDVIANDDGQELYNANDIKIVGKYVDEDSFWGAGVLLYLENNSGKNVTVQCDDMSINGFMMTPYFSSTIYDGKKAIDDITIFSSDLEENGITSIDDIELKFVIIDDDSWTHIDETDAISFSAH